MRRLSEYYIEIANLCGKHLPHKLDPLPEERELKRLMQEFINEQQTP